MMMHWDLMMCHVTTQVVTVKSLMSKGFSNNVTVHICCSA